LDAYKDNARRVMSLDDNMIFFIEENMVPFVLENRKGKEDKTKINVCSIQDCLYFKQKKEIEEIMQSESYKSRLVDPQVPEAWNSLYNIIMWSKIDFVYQATQQNPFNSSHFVWLDFGIHDHILTNNKLNRKLIDREVPDKFRILCRSLPNNTDINIHEFFTSHTNRFTGGFFSASPEYIALFRNLFDREVNIALKVGVVDCDQSIFAILFLKYPELFDIYFGDWRDMIRKYDEPSSSASHSTLNIPEQKNIFIIPTISKEEKEILEEIQTIKSTTQDAFIILLSDRKIEENIKPDGIIQIPQDIIFKYKEKYNLLNYMLLITLIRFTTVKYFSLNILPEQNICKTFRDSQSLLSFIEYLQINVS